jgi:uncharacterized protein Yka (UPF0111/DUF47 family)
MFNFAPHKEKFFDLFKQAAENALAGARALKEMLEHYDNPQDSWKKIKDLEHEGDRITHRTIRSLNQTFLTPIDAEDIHALITALDNVMDAIEAAASRMILFRIDEPTVEARELSDIIVTSTEQLVKAVSHMPRLDDIDEYCIEMTSIAKPLVGSLKTGHLLWTSSNGSMFTKSSNLLRTAAKTSQTLSKPSV